MALLSVLPKVVDVDCYGGDTLTIRVDAPSSLIADREWSAQVRKAPGAPAVDATFIIVPPTETDGPAFLTLPGEVTALLAASGTVVNIGGIGRTVMAKKYTGVWDVQVAPAGGGDPITTLARGSFTSTDDVTRGAA